MYNNFMKIIRLKKVDSTHIYLKDLIKKEGFCQPLCVFSDFQTNGIGSRGNSWTGKKGNLFFSFVLKKDDLPKDLPIQSSSIYFSYILKDILKSFGSKVWLKWPNDFYLEDKKIGGTITNLSSDLVYCGIGLNLIEVEKKFAKLDIDIDMQEVLELYFKKLQKNISWKEIFSCFKVEFHLNAEFTVTIEDKKVPLKYSVLNDDGSIQINNKKVFSLR